MKSKKTNDVEKLETETTEQTEQIEKTEEIQTNTVDAAVEEKAPEEKSKKTAFMYMGPSIKGGVLIHGSVYQEIPKHLDDIFEKAPSVKELFIEVSEINNFKRDLNNQSSKAFRLRRKALEELKEVK